ncbi:hypothetical protein N0V93_001592 [Gnomoniopsis smithogilvyi]|uniref:Uncharacterized protein n=1 Tax=Gnomoniopsis smithogilvyi TaxID=1191159 RepID=A0A9W9D1C8_9PEZI|nr:hypothetical protein N0V93_001592 [Gnomoniopsis smithogilvyi]
MDGTASFRPVTQVVRWHQPRRGAEHARRPRRGFPNPEGDQLRLTTPKRRIELAEVFYDGLGDGERETITEELRVMLDAMRSWTAPNNWLLDSVPKIISSITGGPIRSIRVSDHTMGLFDNERQFTEHLLAPASDHS